MNTSHPTRETDLAFLEDLRFMLETGESFETAAARFGISPSGLKKRVQTITKRLAAGSKQDVREAA